MNMKLYSKSSEKTKKMRGVTEVKGQRGQTEGTGHEIGIMTEETGMEKLYTSFVCDLRCMVIEM